MTLNITKEDVGSVFEDGCGARWRMVAWSEQDGKQFVIGHSISGCITARVYRTDGTYTGALDTRSHLVNRVKPRLSGFVNVYRQATYDTREAADRGAASTSPNSKKDTGYDRSLHPCPR